MRVIPIVALVGDHTLACTRWTIQLQTERLDALIEEHPEMREMLDSNGWTTEALAWGHMIAGLVDLADFDDERGRV